MAFGCLGAFAQIEDEPRIAHDGSIYRIPSEFTKSGKAQIIVYDYYNIDGNYYYDFYVYDEGINLLATIHSSDVDEFYYKYQGTRSYDVLYLTQTLFNDDEKYEYVRLLPDTSFDKNVIQIVSEDGTILQTLRLPEGTKLSYDDGGYSLVSFDKDNNYFEAYHVRSDGKYEKWFYKITKNPSDPSAVSVATTPIKLNVSPRLASRGEPIEVESQSGSMRQVVVTDAAGKVVYDARPAEGQRTVKIDSYRLGHGLNVVNVKHADGSGESCKILVK